MSGLIEQALLTPYITPITDQSTSIRGVNIKIHSSSLITKGVKSLSIGRSRGHAQHMPPYGSRFFHFDMQNFQSIAASGSMAPPMRSMPPLQEILDPPLLSTIKPTLFRWIFISPDEGLLYEVETSWGNFFASFNTVDQSISYVSNVSNRIHKSSRWTFSMKKDVTDINNLWLSVHFVDVVNRFSIVFFGVNVMKVFDIEFGSTCVL